MNSIKNQLKEQIFHRFMYNVIKICSCKVFNDNHSRHSQSQNELSSL